MNCRCVMTMPLVLLASGAVFAGWHRRSAGSSARAATNSGARPSSFCPGHDALTIVETVPGGISWLPLVVGLVGIAVAIFMYGMRPAVPAQLARMFRPIYLFLLNKWYFDELYDFLFVQPAFCHRARLLEGRRRRDHRQARPRRARERDPRRGPAASAFCRAAISITMPSRC